MNLLQRAVGRLNERLDGSASGLVTYARPSTGASIAVLASQGRTPYEQDTGAGVVVSFETTDFLISVAALAALGEPMLGDLITNGPDTYVVGSPTPQQNCFERIQLATRYRIHSKRQETAA